MKHFNFRLFLRSTLVGKMIIDKLTAEGVDRQADARRWIELGYMCEQAGFRLDGGTLFQAGRSAVPVHSMLVTAGGVVEAAHRSTGQPAAPAISVEAAPPRPVEIASALPAPLATAEPAAVAPGATASAQISPAPAGQLDSALLGNLRNLAH